MEGGRVTRRAWLSRVKHLPRAAHFSAALLLIAALWRVDRLIAPQVSMAIFYLLPVGYAAWACGEAWGYAAALLSAGAWLSADMMVEHHFSHWLIPYWNAFARLGFFAVVAGLAGVVGRLRELVERERQVSALKSDMVSLVSHEFGNFLTTFKLSLALLEDSEDGAPPPQRARAYATLNRVYMHLASAVANFLNLNRIEAGRFVPHLRRTALRTLIHGITAQLGPMIETRRVELKLELPPHPVPVKADPDALAIVLSNLMGNAFKYTPDGGCVTVRARLDAGAVVVSVIDTGVGISPEDIERVSKGYYRAENGRRANAKGFGVGLKVARELLATQGTRLSIESRVGQGSKFSFRLPLWVDVSGGPERPPAALSAPRA